MVTKLKFLIFSVAAILNVSAIVRSAEIPTKCHHRLGSNILIVCNNYVEIGREVDHIIIKDFFDIKEDKHLQLAHVQFRNRIVKNRWYDGSEHIQILNFTCCNIEMIEANAFDSNAFHQLRLMIIDHNDGIISFDPDCFSGLNRITIFNMYNSTISVNCFDILRAFRKSLSDFAIRHVSNEIGFKNFFGNSQFTHLIRMTFEEYLSTNFTTLASNNFTGTPFLDSFHAFDCPIEFILDGTFDPIATTLQRLVLHRTKLKTIQLKAFQKYFEYSYMNTDAITIIYGSPLECSCDSYLFHNVAIMGYYGFIFRPYIVCMATNADSQLVCPDHQQIHSKLCWADAQKIGQQFSYYRFRINLLKNIESIVIQTNATGSFKVLLDFNKPRTNQMCCNHEWTRETIKCFIMRANRAELPRSMFDGVPIIRISILYFIHGWPFSVVTLRFKDDDEIHTENTMWLCVSLNVIVSFGSFLLSFLIVIGRQKMSGTVEQEPPMSNECLSQENSYEDSVTRADNDAEHYIEFPDANDEYIYI